MPDDEKTATGPIDSSTSGSKFYEGTICRIFGGSRTGVVRSLNGRDIPFVFLHVQMVGPVRRFEDLREGMRVGFDVGWTSSGLRVSVMRVIE